MKKKAMVEKMIFTKSGDTGMTRTWNGDIVSKTDQRIVTGGRIDHLNTQIGKITVLLESTKGARGRTPKNRLKREDIRFVDDELEQLQNYLMFTGAHISNPSLQVAGILKKGVEHFEDVMREKIGKVVSPLEHFIYYGGGELGSSLHESASDCRIAEIEIVRLWEMSQGEQSKGIDPALLVFSNRSSDFLYMLARYVNKKEHRKEKIWIPGNGKNKIG